MKTFIIILLFASGLMWGQQIDFNNINSKNVQLMFAEQELKLKQESTSVTNIKQFGNFNTAEVYNKAKETDLQITQSGNYNTTLLVNDNSQSSLKSEINVEGNNNYIDITGNNSISENIKLNFQTNDKMIFMRNY